MSSFLRTIQRRILRSRSQYTAPDQPTIHTDEGYYTLRPTRGWMFMSYRRLTAQQKMAGMLDHVMLPRPKKAAKQWRKPAPVPPSIETRQQRRAAAR